jgi:hypothetical protein
MQFITRSLHLLLHTNDCVVVPGIGGFLTNPVSARYDDQRQEWIPPTRDIVFNPRLVVRDGILEQALQRGTEANFSAAAAVVERETSAMRKAMDAGQSIELDGLGRLHLGDDGVVRFHASSRLSEQYAPLGLRRIVWPGGVVSESEARAEHVTAITPEVDSGAKVIAMPRWWRVAAAIALPIGLTATLLWQSPEQSQLNLFDWAPVSSEFSPRLSGEDIRFKAVDATTNYDLMRGEAALPPFSFHKDAVVVDGARIVDELTADRLEAEAEAAAAELAMGCFHHVVAGAFAGADNAHRFSAKLAAAGMTGSMHTGRRGLTLVSAGCFADKGRAMQFRDEIIAKHAVSGAWIWTVNH